MTAAHVPRLYGLCALSWASLNSSGMTLTGHGNSCGGRRTSRTPPQRTPDHSLSPDLVRAHLAELQVHDLLGTDHIISEITYAYPSTSQAAEHRIALYGHAPQALCASMLWVLAACFRPM
jgi:hypothetical protein